MFNSIVIDVAVGLAFTFLAVSLVCSAVVEAINSLLKLRSGDLLTGIKQLVNDPSFSGLAEALYKHASINPRGSAEAPKTRIPAYIDNQQFASAFMDVVGLTKHAATAYADASAAAAAMVADLEATPFVAGDPQLKQFLTGVVQRSKGDVATIRTEIAAWFDNAMDRVSGAYKRRTQLVSFILALALCGLLNVDAISIGRALWKQPALTEALKLPADVQSALEGDFKAPGQATASAPNPGKLQAVETDAALSALAVLDANLAVGWTSERFAKLWTPAGVTIIAGWLLTAIATLFGAPFWFDTLQMFVRVKGSGPSPTDKTGTRPDV